MKKFVAAVAALVVVGSVLGASPAFADTAPVGGTVSTQERPELAAGALPVADPAHPASPPTPRAAETPLPERSLPAAPSAEANAAGAVTISGRVTVGQTAPGQRIAGVIVTATQVDSNDNTIAETDAASDANGDFSITGLANGLYYVSFYYDGDPAGDTAMWWGAIPSNPFGNDAVNLTGSQTLTVYQQLSFTGTVTGRLSTGDRGTTPTSADTELFFTVRSDSDGKYYPVIQLGWGDDGVYGLRHVLPFSNYAIFAVNVGSDRSYAEQSSSDPFSMSVHQLVNRDTIVSKLISNVGGVAVSTNTVINALYWDFLTRAPGSADVGFWNNQFARGAGLGAVSAGFVNSDEYRLIRIDAAYRNILGRSSDTAGRADWLRWMQQGRITTDDIETSFYASQEYYLQHGGTNTSFMQAIYRTLLHRDGSDADYRFWSNLIQQNGRAWVIARFWESTETISERVSLMYATYLGRTPDPDGLAHWVSVALALGDSGLRSGLTGNAEYFLRAQYRFEV